MSTEGHNYYKYNFLTNVIFKIYFPDLGFNENNPPNSFISSLQEQFPQKKQIKGQSVELTIRDFKPSTKLENVVSWELKNNQKQKRVIISSDSLVLENFKYTGFDNFKKDIEFIISKFGDIYPSNTINNLGLRFINQIDLKPPKRPIEWKGLIKPELTSVLDSFVIGSNNISRSLQFLEFNEEDYRLRFQFGLFNSEYPNVISKKEFLLDFDCVTIGELFLSDIMETTKKFHEIIYDLFDKSVDEELKELMKDDEK